MESVEDFYEQFGTGMGGTVWIFFGGGLVGVVRTRVCMCLRVGCGHQLLSTMVLELVCV